MTMKEARHLLAGPLVFGDERQVAALRLLRELEEARERIAHCKRCEGLGVNRRGNACAYCAAKYDGDILRELGVWAGEMPP